MKLLLHICCAPCSIACVQALRDEGMEPTGYWYNPNIHPLKEYRARKVTLMDYARSIDLKLIVNDSYGLRPFVRAVADDIAGRCAACYAMRMRETARYAAENGFTHFSTTLLISPYQNHELLRRTAEAAAKEYGVAFLYRDFRPVFQSGQEQARALGLYMQKYCGCVFSEEDRYAKHGPSEAPVLKPNRMVGELREQMERALWEVGNALDCLRDEVWDKPYCGAPAWQHAYHLLHSLDQWYINPERYRQPALHREGLNDLDQPAQERLSYEELTAYLAQIAEKIRAYLEELTDDQLLQKPEGCEWSRFTLMLGQLRHLSTHLGMLMGFIVDDTGKWPTVLGLTLPIGEHKKYC